MPLEIGSRLGNYEILAPLGAGGMGEVYRAKDTKLGRDVAIKVLPQALAQDPERLARFEREAKVLASLNHPNIAQIYGIEERAIVMELVEGEALKGPLPIETALNYARQIADALEAAHDKGIVHRDLKPANVMITPAGVVKVLDFGLAAVASDSPAEAGATLTMSPTRAGMIMGTAGYMSPEQAAGKPVDRRADIWSFGVVLWELLTGHRLFEGETISHTLADVLRGPIDFDKLPKETPAAIRDLLRRCLDRDVRKRLRDIGEARITLEEGDTPAPPVRAGFNKLAWSVAAVLLVVSAALAFVHFREPPPEARVLRASILPPDGTAFNFATSFGVAAISPDGQRLVFGATSAEGKTQLWVRSLDALTAQPLAGTEGATFPFWSPDSRFIGFFAGGKLKKIEASGGPALTLANAPIGRGGTWSRDGVIVFAPATNGPLQRVSASGGPSSLATTLDEAKGETVHTLPWFLPDGRHFLYAAGRLSSVAIVVRIASLDSQEHKDVAEANSSAIYSAGYLLFLRENTLMAQPFDAKLLTAAGEPRPIAERIQLLPVNGRRAVFSASDEGLLVYQTGTASAISKLTWFDRTGKPAATLGDAAGFSGIEFSPDRRSLAAEVPDAAGNEDLWVYDVARGLPTRFTFDPARDRLGPWSPDGRTIFFFSDRKGHFNLYRKSSNGAGAEEVLYEDSLNKFAENVSPDGKFLMFSSNDPKTGSDLWVLPLTGAPKPSVFLRTPFGERDAQFSPDGRWVAYRSNESEKNEIYAVPFPGPGGKRQISSGGGSFPRWRRDGKEIFYIGPDQRLMAAEVTAKSDTLEVGAVRALSIGPLFTNRGYSYDVSADGQHILAAVAPEQKAGDPLTLVRNWTAGLKK